MSKVNLYFCGGAGALISRFLPEKIPEFCAKPTIHYLDTSDSEKSFHRPDGKFTMFYEAEVKSGSGGVRSGKVDLIRTHLPGFVVDNPHADINIIVVSTSGASGAVISHFLAEDMVKQGKKVIVLISQSPTTYVRAGNSLKSLMGYRHLATKHKNSIVGWVYEAIGAFEASDRYLVQDLTVLLHLLNGKIQGVDDSDLETMLSPERLPDMEYAADFYSLSLLFENRYQLETSPISILTLSPPGSVDDIKSGAVQTYSGVVDEEAYSKMYAADSGEPVLSLAVFDCHVPSWLTALSRAVDALKQRIDVKRVAKTEISKNVDLSNTTDSGLII
jgi:hypothetical protein